MVTKKDNHNNNNNTNINNNDDNNNSHHRDNNLNNNDNNNNNNNNGKHIVNISKLEVALNIVFLIVHSANIMLFNSVFVRVDVLCCF